MYSSINEPVYEDLDADGDISKKQERPKWSLPSSEFQKKFLLALGHKYFNKKEKGQVIMLEKEMMSLESGFDVRYPTEWVHSCLDWAIKQNRGRPVITWKALWNLINDVKYERQRINDFVERYRRQMKDIKKQVIVEPTKALKVNMEDFDWS